MTDTETRDTEEREAPPPPPSARPKGDGEPRRPRLGWGFFLFLLALLYLAGTADTLGTREIRYSDFKSLLREGRVRTVVLQPERIVGQAGPEEGADEGEGPAPNAPAAPDASAASAPASEETTEPKIPPTAFSFRTVRVEDPKLVELLEERGVDYRGEVPSMLGEILWMIFLPLLLFLPLWLFLMARSAGPASGLMRFGQSRAKLHAESETKVSFEDVAGCEEAKVELEEVVDFLKQPKRYQELGARIPKGVLLVGPPGTGKTLLARAVAGEAGVPFYSISGSDFVEMFVGVGASRVRDLFEQAKGQAPCIVFLDELDAIGRQRGVHVGAVNDEREQTLNQLLVEMDGFEPHQQTIILLAATNRPDVLDPALLRPGRFDRQVIVDAPDMQGRKEILQIHARGKPLSSDVDLESIARATPGFSGADLANAVNEAALLAARRGLKEISQEEMHEAVERVVAGPERRSRRLGDEERRRVAFHEVGHALVSVRCPHADPVHKISIVPRGKAALGYTMQLPQSDRYLRTEAELLDRVTSAMGGRAAEELVFGQVSTGAENDLEKATAIVRQMVCRFGMNPRIGLTHCAKQEGPQFMPGMTMQRDCSEETAREIDEEVHRILDECYVRARGILERERDLLGEVAEHLLEVETLDEDTFAAMVGGETVGEVTVDDGETSAAS